MAVSSIRSFSEDIIVPSWSRESARWFQVVLLAFGRCSVKVSAKCAIWLRSRAREDPFDGLGPSRRGLMLDNRSAWKTLVRDCQTTPTKSTHDWIIDFQNCWHGFIFSGWHSNLVTISMRLVSYWPLRRTTGNVAEAWDWNDHVTKCDSR